MQRIHWNYFFAIEDDLATLSRYVEFHEDNFTTYSIEIARILMTAVARSRCSAEGDMRSLRRTCSQCPGLP